MVLSYSDTFSNTASTASVVSDKRIQNIILSPEKNILKDRSHALPTLLGDALKENMNRISRKFQVKCALKY